jgi:hypothetical protein
VDTRVICSGDNVDQLAKLPDTCFDLIYIDPPLESTMISYQIEGPFLHIIAAGIYSVEDIRRTYEAAAADAQLPPQALLLMDVRDTASTFNLDEMRERVKLFGPLIPKIAPFCAIVAADPDRRHFSRHLQLSTSESFAIHVAIFYTLEAARAWLLAW